MGDANIILTGMMGAGKSTIGRLLATRLQKRHIDLDELIQERAGMTVREIFSRYGETYFRNLETLALEDVLMQGDQVVATGGGAVIREENRNLMEDHFVVWLAIDSATAAKRLAFDGSRPLLGVRQGYVKDVQSRAENAMESWLDLAAARQWAYSHCHWVVDGSLTPEAIAEEISYVWSKMVDGKLGQVSHLLVDVKDEPYCIHLGHGILANLGNRCRAEVGSEKVVVVSNPTVFELYGEVVANSLDEADIQWQTVLIPDGENYKNLATVEQIYAAAFEAGLDRRSGIIALGGGVVGDAAGLVAATYLRGIKFIQVPTTLLAQVDSSVGGKVGVNHPKGKNLIGAFYQPKLVLADVDTLRTLPERQFLTGMAEIIKYTAIFDEMFMQEVESYAGGAAPESVLMAWIQRSCQIKAQVVVADAKEAGYREILNFGHTVGHAVEKVSGYGEYTHGEAIAMGMVTAGILSYIKGYLQQEDCYRLIRVLEGWRLPTVLPDGLPLEEIVKACYRDKKVRLGQLRFVLLKSLGRAEAAKVVTEGELLRALEMQQGGWL